MIKFKTELHENQTRKDPSAIPGESASLRERSLTLESGDFVLVQGPYSRGDQMNIIDIGQLQLLLCMK